jgi:hypothetical protein
MSKIETLKQIKKEYHDLFNNNFKELMKQKNKKKRYTLAQIQASLDLCIKYCQEFDKW